MINVITEFGTSFKGLAAYLLHDVDHAQTSNRVAWTHTHNLATDNPERASRIMAATAMQQADLKREAGIKGTGRKSNKHVLHYVLSWSPEERGEYSKEAMVDAALASMAYIGAREGERLGKKVVAKRTQYADEHQAVIVCHEEPDKNPHVHVMLNRVHPRHGVMVSDSKDREKLSAWALDYRRSQGKEHLCPDRVKNAAKRAQGVLVSHPRKPRNVYEQEQAIAGADPASRKKALLEQQIRRAKELTARSEALKARRAKLTHGLEERHTLAERAERTRTVRSLRDAKTNVRRVYTPRIERLIDRHADELQKFNDARGSAAGHVRNTWEAFKTREWMSEIRTRPLHTVTSAFELAFSSGLQQRQLEAFHAREHGQLRGARARDERAKAVEIRDQEKDRLGTLRSGYIRERNDLLLAIGMDRAKLKAEWKQLERDRVGATAEGGRGRKATPGVDAWIGSSGGQRERADRGSGAEVPIDELRRAAQRVSDMLKDQDKECGADRDNGIEME